MKIAVTGHTAGIGKSISDILENRGHEIIGLSRRNGWNIRVTPKIVEAVIDCDIFINNAQTSFAQTELLFAVWEKWKGNSKKHIWCIGTMMSQYSMPPAVKGLSELDLDNYHTQKNALEDAVQHLRCRDSWPYITMIRPGAIATQPGQVAPWPYADVNVWAEFVVNTLISAYEKNMRVSELSVGPTKNPADL